MLRDFRYWFLVFAVKAGATAVFLTPSSAFGATDVLTWHNDPARTGLNPREWTLSPGNVNATDFGKIWGVNLDGQIYAQPLVVSGLEFPGRDTYNVVYAATEHGSVYALTLIPAFSFGGDHFSGPVNSRRIRMSAIISRRK